MVNEEQKRCSPKTQKNPLTESNVQNSNTLFSPRFKNAAALAGWDEEALLLASLVVEDTPDRDSRTKKRFVLNSKSPHTNSRRKRRVQRSPHSIPVAVLNLDEEDTPKKESGKKKKEKKTTTNEGSKIEGSELKEKVSNVSSSNSALPCIDKLRDELSCAICLEICFEPSTTPCGHSFCRKCLRSAADKCGKKCPKCRQLISNGRSCTVNTVLWNTIQLLFPQEVEARKAASASKVRHTSTTSNIPEAAFYSNLRNQSTERASGASSRGMSTRRNNVIIEDEDAAASVRRFRREIDGQSRGSRVVHVHNNSRNGTSSSVRTRTRRGITTSQDEDAALAQRLQREEFMQAFRGTSQEQQTSGASSLSLARANVRAMALRMRDRRT